MKPLLASALLAVACAAPVSQTPKTTPRENPAPEFIPTVAGTCPELHQGTNRFLGRQTLVWVSDEAGFLDGPLVYFWHGAGGDPTEATYALGLDNIRAITAAGGVVVAPVHDPGAGSLPWYLSGGGSDDIDLRVADEILACVQQSVGIDLRHIHSVGFSAGAMHNTQFAAFRSGYLATIVNYSGARLSEPDEEDASNKYPAMLFHGGPTDQVFVDFPSETLLYRNALNEAGHDVVLCAHTEGHTVPGTGIASAWQFLQDHPFGANPEPYLAALPSTFPDYCTFAPRK